jgi:hypothetical protein
MEMTIPPHFSKGWFEDHIRNCVQSCVAIIYNMKSKSNSTNGAGKMHLTSYTKSVSEWVRDRDV